jgi:hypothetical protein
MQIVHRAANAGARNVLVVGNQSRLTPRFPSFSGLNVCITPAELESENFSLLLRQQERFDLCLFDLSLVDLTNFRELLRAAKHFMRLGGTVVGYYFNPDVDELPFDPQDWAQKLRDIPTAHVHYSGSPLSTKALRAYRAAVLANRASRVAFATQFLLRFPLTTIRALIANLQSRFGNNDRPVSAKDCSSITIEVSVPKLFEGDDGTLKYSKSAGLYLDGVDAPVFPDRAVAAEVARKRDTAIILTFGQSNAANLGDGPYAAKKEVYVYNIFDCEYYRAIDPLPGATNNGGSVWSRLGDRLVEADMYRSVLFIPIAYGGSFITEWAPGGVHYRRLQFATQRMHAGGLVPDVLCWHQGEAEANHTDMTADEYRRHFLAMLNAIRGADIMAPIYVATATLCADQSHPKKNHEAIRTAQRELVSLKDNILPGPDTDMIGIEHRWDGCHFAASGLDLAADAWLKAFAANPVALRRARRSSA